MLATLPLLALALLTACEESDPTQLPEPTSTPTATAQPTATPTPTPSATPTLVHAVTPLPFNMNPADSDVAAIRGTLKYAAQCGTITPYVGGRRATLTWTFYEPPEATWGEVAQEVRDFLDQYAILEKPALLEEYHEVNLAAWEELLQAAGRKPSEQSVRADIHDLEVSLSTESFLSLAGSSMTSDEATLQVKRIEERMLGELLGLEIGALDREALDILPTFPPLIEGPLKEYGCFPPLQVFSLNHKGSVLLRMLTQVPESPALIALFVSTDGPNWRDNTNWLTSVWLGNWHGVTTNAEGGVKGVSLRRNGLTGEIPAEAEALSQLSWLYLASNRLSGCIPKALEEIPENDLDSLGLPFCE